MKAGRKSGSVSIRPKINLSAFVRSYIEGKKIADCAKDAGCTGMHPMQRGYQILAKPEVKNEILRQQGEVEALADQGWRRGITNIVKIVEGFGVNRPSTNKEIIDGMELLGRYRGLFENKFTIQVGVLPRISHLSDEVQDIGADVVVSVEKQVNLPEEDGNNEES